MQPFLILLPIILGYTVFAVYAERKLSGYIQDRVGPKEVGYQGLLQTVADLLKLLQKEDVIAENNHRILFSIAPIVLLVAVLAGFAVLPISTDVQGAYAVNGLYYLLAIISLDVIALLMTGWGSNSKFSLYGSLRAAAQIVSYEIPFGLSVLCVLLTTSTFQLNEIDSLQAGENAWGFMKWNVVQYPLLLLVFPVYFISSLAEANRAPFDIPESESELIGGYHTEYSGFRWSMLMLSEYAVMLLVSLLGAILFFGGTSSPIRLFEVEGVLPNQLSGAFWLFSKAFLLIFLQMWVRWTFPRLRVDQLMALCWKYLIPLSFGLLMLIAALKVFSQIG